MITGRSRAPCVRARVAYASYSQGEGNGHRHVVCDCEFAKRPMVLQTDTMGETVSGYRYAQLGICTWLGAVAFAW